MSDIQFKISSDSRQAQTDLQKLSKSVANIENTAKNAESSLAGLGKSIAAAFAAFGAGTVIKDAADSFVNLNTKLSLSVDGMENLIKTQQALLAISQRTRTTMDSTASVFSTLAKSLKKPREEILAITETIQQAGIISGGSAESLKAALTQFSQGLQSGTLRGEELNSVLEQAPRLARAIADGMGVSIGKMRELAAAGQVTSDEVFKSLKSQSAQIQKEFNKVGLTIEQSMIQLSNVSKIALGEILTESGFSSSISEAISAFAASIGRNKDLIVTNSVLISARLTGIADTATRLYGVFAPLFRQIGVEIGRVIPTISFLQLQLGQKLNIAFLYQLTEQSIVARTAILGISKAIRQSANLFGADFKSDFFEGLQKVVASRSIPELEKNVKNLTKILSEPATLLGTITKSLTGDTSLFTALADYFNYREISKLVLGVREFLASIGLVQNRLLTFGNLRFDKFEALGDYITEIQRLFVTFGTVVFQGLILKFQTVTQVIGSYFIEAGRSVGGGLGAIIRSIGSFIFELSGYSRGFETFFVSITNTITQLGLAAGIKFVAGLTKSATLVKSALDPISAAFDTIIRYGVNAATFIARGWESAFSKVDLSGLLNSAKTQTISLGSIIGGLLNNAIGRLQLEQQIQLVAETFESLVDKIKAKTAALNSVKQAILSFGKYIKEVFFDIYDKVVGNSYWPDMIDGVVDYAKGLWPKVKSGFEELRKGVLSIFKSLANSDTKVGIQLIGVALSSGLKVATGMIYNFAVAMKFLLAGMVDLGKSVDDISSFKEWIGLFPAAVSSAGLFATSLSKLTSEYWLLLSAVDLLKTSMFVAFVNVGAYVEGLGNKLGKFTDELGGKTLSTIKSFGKEVINVFFTIYDKVVGNSYWPDLIEGVDEWAGRLLTGTLGKIKSFGNKVQEAFATIRAPSFSLRDVVESAVDKLDVDFDMSAIGSKLVAVLVGYMLIAIFSPATFKVIGTAITAAILKSTALGADNVFGSLFDVSILKTVGYDIGVTIGSFIVEGIKQIPEIVGGLVNLASGLIEGLISQIPVLGGAINGIFSLLTGGNLLAIPLLLWPDVFLDKASKVINSILEITGLIQKADSVGSGKDGKGGGAGVNLKDYSDKLTNTLFGGKVDTSYIKKAALVLLTAFSSQISLFQASLVATPLILVAIFGEDVSGKIVRDLLGKTLAKMAAQIAAFKTSGTILESVIGSLFGAERSKAILKTGKDSLASIFNGLNRVLDQERKDQYAKGAINLKEYIFGTSFAKQGFTSADFSVSGGGLDAFANESVNKAGKAAEKASSKFSLKSFLSKFLLGDNPVASFGQYNSFVSAAEAKARTTSATLQGKSLLDSALGTATDSTKKAYDSVRNFSLGDKFGAFGRFLFGKGGAIAAIIAGILTISTSANAAIGDNVAKITQYATEAGLLGSLILGNDWTRGKLLDGLENIFNFLGTKIPILGKAGGVLKTVFTSSLRVAATLLTSTAAAIAGVAVATVGAIYYVGEGETVISRFGDGVRKTANSFIYMLTGIKDAFPAVRKQFDQFGEINKIVNNTSENLAKVNKELSGKFDKASANISLRYLTGKEPKELKALSDAMNSTVTKMKKEQEELGEVSAETTRELEKQVARYEKFSARVSSKQAVDITLDAQALVSQFAPIKPLVEKSVSQFIVEGLQLVSSGIGRLAAYPLDLIANAINAGINAVFDTKLAADPFVRFFERIGAVLTGDQTSAIFSDWATRFSGEIQTDSSYLQKDIADAAKNIEFAFKLFPDLGEGDLLGAESSAIKADLIKASEDIKAAKAELATLDKKGFRFLSAEDRAALEADKEFAQKRLEDATKTFAEVAAQAARLKQRAIDVSIFQKAITDLSKSLDTLKIDFNKTTLFGSTERESIDADVKRLAELREALLKVKDAKEARAVIGDIGELEATIKLKLDRSTSVTFKEEIDQALKAANISGVEWTDLFNFNESEYQSTISKLKNVAELTTQLNTARLNGDFGRAKALAEQLKNESRGVKNELDAAAAASRGLASALLGASFGNLGDFSKFYSASGKTQERLTSITKQLTDLKIKSENIELGGISGRGSVADVERYKREIAGQAKKLLSERDKIIEGFTPKEKEKPKTALENLGEVISKANIKSSLEDVIQSGLPLSEIVGSLNKILDANKEIDKLPKDAKGLPKDLALAGTIKNRISTLTKALDEKIKPNLLNDVITEKFKFSPDILDKIYGPVPEESVKRLSEISAEIESKLKEKYDSSGENPILSNLLRFSENKARIKQLTEEASALIGISIKDSLSSINLSLVDLFKYDSGTREKVLKIATDIRDVEKDIKKIQDKPLNPSNLKELAERQEKLEELQRLQRKLTENPLTIGGQAKTLGLDLSVILTYDEAARANLIKDKLRLLEIDEQINKTGIKEASSLQSILAERKSLVDKEKELNEVRSRRQALEQEFMTNTTNLFTGIFKGEKDSFSKYVDNMSNTILTNFSKQLTDSLFSGESQIFGSMFGDLFGPKTLGTSSNPMNITFKGLESFIASVNNSAGGTANSAGGNKPVELSQDSKAGIASPIQSAVGLVTQGVGSLFALTQIASQRQTTTLGRIFQILTIIEITQKIMLIFQKAAATISAFKFFATGGFVSGPGTGTSDSIPAMLSNGEYVINANTTKKIRPLLEALNSGRVPKFATGGYVDANKVGSRLLASMSPLQEKGNNSTIVNLTITGDISRQTKAEINKMLPSIAEGVNSHNKEKGYR